MANQSTEEPAVQSGAGETARARAAGLIGRVVSQRYRIDELIAMGGMGAVYRGHHLLLKKRVAIKILHPETDNLPELVARFEREAIAGAHVAHANVAAATDFGKLEDGSYFLVLEYVSGETLHEVIERGPLPVARAAHVARQLAAGLAAVHAMGIVHRDVKPRNVMLVPGKDDLAKLIDFGLAKVPVDRVVAHQSLRPPAGSIPDLGAVGKPPRRPRLDSLQDSKPRLTGVGMIVGTVAYLAPEAALGMEAVDARADLYALGLILYQMLAGRHPFDADNDVALFNHQRFTPPPPLAIRAPLACVPPALEAVVMRLLEKDPSARYPTGAAVVDALDPARILGTAPPAPAGGPRSVAPVLVGAASIVFGVVAALLFNGSSVGSRIVVAPKPSATVAPAVSAVTPVIAVTARAPASSTAVVAAPSAASAIVPIATTSAPDVADAANQRTLLLRALRVHDWNGGEAAFLDLVGREPAMFQSPEMAVAARELAVALDREGKGDRVFDALTNRLGPAGLDVLYDLVATKGRAGAALRAGSVLRAKGMLARATPEMRIAFQLREATCIDKLPLLDRAAREGDGRALVVLQTQGAGCFKKHNRALLEAMTALRSRLNRGQ